jgi:hypothetical protein
MTKKQDWRDRLGMSLPAISKEIQASASPLQPKSSRPLSTIEDTPENRSPTKPTNRNWRGPSHFSKRPTTEREAPAKPQRIMTGASLTRDEISVYNALGWMSAAESMGFKLDYRGDRIKVPRASEIANPFDGPGHGHYTAGATAFKKHYDAVKKTQKPSSSIDDHIFMLLQAKKRSFEDAKERVADAEGKVEPSPASMR